MHVFLKVHSVNLTSEKKKFDGALVSYAEAIVGDKFGSFKLIARDYQLPLIEEGATLALLNAHAKVVKEKLTIEVDKWGVIKRAAPEDSIKEEVNTANNYSEEEYELVPDTSSEKA